ncbi:MPPalpha1 [Symbiodinium microadriaticum]|nr:MPPalpha1 [Symbiodinium microadriaticum]
MYLFGGSTGSARNDLYAFSFETDQWTEVRTTPGAQKSNVPCPRFCHTCDVYNNSLYVFGGYDGQQRLNDFWQFKLATEVNIDIPSSSLVSDLREFLNDAKLSDVTFIVEGKPVYAHKLLCMRCSYFRAMFEGQMREAQQKTITINNVSHRVFLALLEYLYTDEFEISMDIAMDLFVAADQFGIDRLKRLCEKKILVSINIDSAATILQAANMHIANDLRQSCMDFILRNFDAVSKTLAFEEMGRSNVELVFEILKRGIERDYFAIGGLTNVSQAQRRPSLFASLGLFHKQRVPDSLSQNAPEPSIGDRPRIPEGKGVDLVRMARAPSGVDFRGKLWKLLVPIEERVFDTEKGVEQVVLGLYVIRGDNLVIPLGTAVVGEVDEEIDSRIDLSHRQPRFLESRAPCQVLFRDALHLGKEGLWAKVEYAMDRAMVKFVKEDVEKVMMELPDYSFYEFKEAEPNPYQGTTLDRSILLNPPAPALTQPKFEFSKLENGMKIASIDKQGLTARLGLYVHAGARFEVPGNLGAAHMSALMGFRSTAHLSHLRTVKTLEQLGAHLSSSATAGREEIAYQVQLQREYMPLAVPLMVGNVLFPRLLPWEVKAAQSDVPTSKQALTKDADTMVSELLHKAAYCNNTLGLSPFASERSMGYFTPETIRTYMLDHFAPERMVFVGVNVDHAELSKWVMRARAERAIFKIVDNSVDVERESGRALLACFKLSPPNLRSVSQALGATLSRGQSKCGRGAFADYNAIPLKKREEKKAQYTGGDMRLEGASPYCHLALGQRFESTAFGQTELAPVALVQALLSGGSAIYSGIGSGVTSRLSTQVLRQSPYVESCAAFNTSYSDSGLFGVYGVCQPEKASEMAMAMASALKGLSSVSKEELAKAKAMLKGKMFRQADDDSELMQDMGQQVLLTGKYGSAAEFGKIIDGVTEADVTAAAKKILGSKLSLAAYGDVHSVPHYAAIEAALK